MSGHWTPHQLDGDNISSVVIHATRKHMMRGSFQTLSDLLVIFRRAMVSVLDGRFVRGMLQVEGLNNSPAPPWHAITTSKRYASTINRWVNNADY